MIKLNIPHQPNQYQFNAQPDLLNSASSSSNGISQGEQVNKQIDDVAVYRFDNLRKELTTSVHNSNNTNETVRFACQDEEENSNEILLSVNQDLNKTVDAQTYQYTNANIKTDDMEWNDTDLFQLCQDFDDDNIFNNNNNNNNSSNIGQGQNKQIEAIKNELSLSMQSSDSSYVIYNGDANRNGYNQLNAKQYNQTMPVYNFDTLQDAQQLQQIQYGQLINNNQQQQSNEIITNTSASKQCGDPLMSRTTLFIENNSESNILIPWELENDFNQINYLQSPTI